MSLTVASIITNNWPISSSNECLVLNDKIDDLATVRYDTISDSVAGFLRYVVDVIDLPHQPSFITTKSGMRHVTHPALTDR